MPRARVESVGDAVDLFLSGRELAGADLVRAALARRLAAAVETAPEYALPRLAAVLAGLVDTFEPVEAEPIPARDARRMLRAVTGK